MVSDYIVIDVNPEADIVLACEGTPKGEPDECCWWEHKFSLGTRLNDLIAAAEEHVLEAHR